MEQQTLLRGGEIVRLPDTAPRVRLTAGAGTASQKTWNLRRPVTLIGSKRPAHIVLHDQVTSRAHCVILNTGTAVVLKDLCSDAGTARNGARIDGAEILEDGDSITIGTTTLQIEVEMPTERPFELPSDQESPLADPSTLPVAVCLENANDVWRVDDAIALIGRHPDAMVRLDQPNVAKRHALLFPFLGGPAIFDVGGATGVWVSGRRCTFARLASAERVLIGPFALTVWFGESLGETSTDDSEASEQSPFARRQRAAKLHTERGAQLDPDTRWESWLATLRRNSAGSWERMHVLPQNTQAVTGGSLCDSRANGNAEARGGPGEAGRGSVGARGGPRDGGGLGRSDGAGTEVETDGSGADADEANGQRREEALARREADVHRREQLLTRRWTQLLSMSCSRCGHPLATPQAAHERQSSPPDPPTTW